MNKNGVVNVDVRLIDIHKAPADGVQIVLGQLGELVDLANDGDEEMADGRPMETVYEVTFSAGNIVKIVSRDRWLDAGTATDVFVIDVDNGLLRMAVQDTMTGLWRQA